MAWSERLGFAQFINNLDVRQIVGWSIVVVFLLATILNIYIGSSEDDY